MMNELIKAGIGFTLALVIYHTADRVWAQSTPSEVDMSYGDVLPQDWLADVVIPGKALLGPNGTHLRPLPCQVLFGNDVHVSTDANGIHHVTNREIPGAPILLAIGHGCLFLRPLKSAKLLDINWTEPNAVH